MTLKKGTGKKIAAKFKKDEAIIPTKETAERRKKILEVTKTGVEERPRVNSLATVGKKKKPK